MNSSSVPATQRAIVQARYGPAPAVLSWAPAYPVVPPTATQVQIRVHAAAMNPIDWQMLEGNRALLVKRTFPFVPLFDLAGIVVAVGAAVTRFKPGDAVHADNKLAAGGGAEYVAVEQDLVSLKPVASSFAEAAALPLAAQTALLALEKGRVGVGSRVCIIGASGGVGSLAVQLAKALGAAQVLGVCSGANQDFVRSLGADQVIDYTQHTLSAALPPRSLDVVLDCVGGRAQWEEAKKVLVPGGRFATIARDEDGPVTVRSALRLVAGVVGRKLRSLVGQRIQYVVVFLDASHQLLDRVDAFVRAGQLRVPISQRYPFTLAGAQQMLADSKAGRVVGKTVLEIIPEAAATR